MSGERATAKGLAVGPPEKVCRYCGNATAPDPDSHDTWCTACDVQFMPILPVFMPHK